MVFTASGKVEMEASIMSSEDAACGSCLLVNSVKNPIKLARLVMETTPHIMLAGKRGRAETVQALGLGIVLPWPVGSA